MKPKLKICSDCGKPSILWKSNPKLCKNCAGKPKYKKAITADKKSDIIAKNVFFASQVLVFPQCCENCNRPLKPKDSFDKRSMTCHILPKKPGLGGFPSVATHPENKVFMCWNDGCYGHGKWDNGNSDDRKKMPVYETAMERFLHFRNLLTPNEQVRADKLMGV